MAQEGEKSYKAYQFPVPHGEKQLFSLEHEPHCCYVAVEGLTGHT